MFRRLRSATALVVFSGIVIGQPCAAIAAQAPAKTTAAPAATTIVNLNTASVKDLEVLPGIGARTAERIIEYRQKNGPFKKIEELMNVSGIGEKSFLRLRSQLTVGAKPESADRPAQ